MEQLDVSKLVEAHNAGMAAAAAVTTKFLATHGDRDCCGFAWVTCYEKGTSKLIREMKKLGFKRSFGGGYQLWNPSKNPTQAITAKEEGARAYVDTFKKYFPDVSMFAGSRLD